MRTQNSDTDTLIAALRSDLPSADDDARMRAKLAAAGAYVGASMVGAVALQASVNGGAVSGALATAAKGTTAAAGLNGGGLLSTIVGALPLSGGAGVKALVVFSALATGVSYPLLAPQISDVFHRTGERSEPRANVNVPRHKSPAPNQSDDANSVPLALGVDVRQGFDAEHGAPVVAVPEVKKSPGRGAELVPSVVSPQHSLGTRTSTGSSKLVKPTGAKRDIAEDPAAAKAAIVSTPSVEVSVSSGNANPTSGVLAEETHLIERALQAQRAGDVRAARSWLGMHQQKFPDGKLTTERARIWAQLQD